MRGAIEIHPGNRPGVLTVYLRQDNGSLRKLPQNEVDQILRGMSANMEKFQRLAQADATADEQLPG